MYCDSYVRLDFQPEEPFSPLFGAMKKTAVMPEFQMRLEYLGQSTRQASLSGKSLVIEYVYPSSLCNPAQSVMLIR
jgi:alpha-glucuronidase